MRDGTRRKGRPRKNSTWYRDPKLAAYWVYEDLRTRPRRFEWDLDPCLHFGGRSIPVEPMPRKVVWEATGSKNYYDLGRGGRIPLPEKTPTWTGPTSLVPTADNLEDRQCRPALHRIGMVKAPAISKLADRESVPYLLLPAGNRPQQLQHSRITPPIAASRNMPTIQRSMFTGLQKLWKAQKLREDNGR